MKDATFVGPRPLVSASNDYLSEKIACHLQGTQSLKIVIVKLHGNDLVIVDPNAPEMILEYREQKIALAATPDTGNDFYKTVMHDGLDFI